MPDIAYDVGMEVQPLEVEGTYLIGNKEETPIDGVYSYTLIEKNGETMCDDNGFTMHFMDSDLSIPSKVRVLRLMDREQVGWSLVLNTDMSKEDIHTALGDSVNLYLHKDKLIAYALKHGFICEETQALEETIYL